MFLLGDPGPHLRNLVLRFAWQTGREVEYIGITRDTVEADLKQRREITSGRLVFHNGPAVRAALCGRLLILEGVQKAERNVLPLLNNLLENREMALEDGSFLMAPGREAEIQGQRLLPVSSRFLVVAIGLLPKYQGQPLDPPLRSRFAARLVTGDHHQALKELRGVVELWRQAELPRFPEFGLLSVKSLLELFPGLPEAMALHSAYPWTLLPLSPQQRLKVQSGLKMYNLELPTAQQYALKGVELQARVLKNPHQTSDLNRNSFWWKVTVFSSAEGGRARLSFQMPGAPESRALCPCGAWPSGFEDVTKRLAPSQRSLLARMLQDHAAGMDLCLVGERGVGKTLLAKAFADVLSYRSYSVFCFKDRREDSVGSCGEDMTARELTLRRATDQQGNTIWQASPLMQAVLEGGLAILDGIHRLPCGALAETLGRLLCDRAADLPDGTKLVPQEGLTHALPLRKQKLDQANTS